MKNFLLSGLIFGLSSALFAQTTYTIEKTNKTIVIDGDLSEWTNIPQTKSFTNHQTGASGSASVKAQMMWDNTNLYLAFDVTDNDITANYTNQDDNLFNNDDLVEMFFDFDGSGTNYLELGVSAKGVNYDFNIICPSASCGGWNSDASWDITGLETAAIVDGTLNNSGDTDNGYKVEVKIPLASLSTMSGGNYSTVSEGSTWKGNLYKINYNTGAAQNSATDYLSWETYGTFGFHQPSKFATFEFGELTVGNDEIGSTDLKFHPLGNNNFQISSSQYFSIRTTNLLGKEIVNIQKSKNYQLDLNGLKPGIYLIQTIQSGKITVNKVMVR